MKRQLTNLMYRLKIRKALVDAPNEHLNITLEETRKEIERRNKKK